MTSSTSRAAKAEVIEWIEKHGGKLRHRDAGISIKPLSVTGTRRVVQFAFDYARRNGRRKVTAVHKANIMKFTDGLYLRVAQESPRTRTSNSTTGSWTTCARSSSSGPRSTTSSSARTCTATSSPTSPPG